MYENCVKGTTELHMFELAAKKKKKTPEEVNNFLVMKVFITLSPDYAADSYLVSGLIFHPESLKLFLALKVKQ